MIRIFLCVLLVVMNSASVNANQSPDIALDGVPLPGDLVLPSNTDREAGARFDGLWTGRWDSFLKHILVVRTAESGETEIIYAWGENPARGFEAGWVKAEGKIDEDLLTVTGKRFKATYRLSATGNLVGVFGDLNGFTVLTSTETANIPVSAINPKWDRGTQLFLDTKLRDDGNDIHLEAIVFKPPGDGPFPLAVVNHGSTGAGNHKSEFAHTWTDDRLAEYLNERGYVVAFPQRRGRGKSNGLYDEGFHADRSKGYTCEPERSLAGADRALEDIDAAIEALRKEAYVAAGPLLLAGQSRGGALSVAYAGMHPDDVAGVINFVGGWMGDGCPQATLINQSVMNKGAAFPHPMLWLYGLEDYYYSSAHNQSNFEAFIKAGGTGKFHEIQVGGEGAGHFLINVPPLWQLEVDDYLEQLGAAR